MNGSNQASMAQVAPSSPKSTGSSRTPLVDSSGNPLSTNAIHLKEEGPWKRVDSLEDHINDRLYRLEQERYELQLVKEKAKLLKFKVGDAARHPRYGNVLVTDIYCKPMHSHNLGINWPEDKPEVVFQYGIVFTGGADGTKGYGRTDSAVVQTEDLIPITEMAETLFRK